MCCPDDGATLQSCTERFVCAECGRVFPVRSGCLVELLPAKPTNLEGEVSHSYFQGYLQEFHRTFTWDESAAAWGAPEYASRSWVQKRNRQVRGALPLLAKGAETNKLLLCDLSAGAGYYTFDYATHFRTVLHCDLSVDSLNYEIRKAKRLGLNNIIFLRVDYFSPPFRKSLDRVLCFDTLIRGEAHERLLLEGIRRTLTPDGCALVDFHNWWHNPLRRLGLLRQNFGENRSYTRHEAEMLVQAAGIVRCEVFPFHQEFGPDQGVTGPLRKIFPPTRLIWRFTGQES